jgi:hypothetical protein
MKAERFSRTRSVAASSAIALVVAALVFGLTSLVVGPKKLGSYELTAGTNFGITSTISSSSSSQVPATLNLGPAATYLWYNVSNSLSVPITVNSLDISGVTAPAGCAASNLDLSRTTFSGSLLVPAKVGSVNGTNAVAVPISLIDDHSNSQDGCKNVTFNFTYTGTAQFTDATSTSLAATPLLPVLGQPVSLTATVTAANQTTDPNGPTGTVTFYVCPTATCTSRTSLGTASVGSNGKATLSTLALLVGTNHVEAVYGGSGTNFTGSTSNVLALPIVAVITAPANATNGSGTPGTSSSTSPTVAFTGADIAGMVAGGLVLIGVGTFLVLAVRRKHRTVQS